MKTISIVNRKGGTGKTNISLNLAVELSQKYKVLMIDMDPQMDLTDSFRIINGNDKDILDVLYDTEKIENTIIPMTKSLGLIKGNENINHYEKDNNGKDLKNILSQLDEEYDYIIIDYPPTLLEAGVQGIVASDEAIIVTEAEAYAFKNIDSMIEDLKVIKEDIDIKIMINKLDMRRKLSEIYINKIKLKYANKVFEEYISVSTAFPNANNLKISLRDLKWWPKPLTQLRKVMKEIGTEEEE